MNKSEMIDYVATQCDIPKTTAKNAIDAALGFLTKHMVQGESVTLIGFGTFSTLKRQAREGRNPRTLATIKIPAKRVPVFRPGSQLKNIINKHKSKVKD